MYCAQEHLDEDFRGQGVGGKATLRLDGKKRLIMRKNPLTPNDSPILFHLIYIGAVFQMERWMDQRSGNHRCSNQGPTTTPSTK
jgi:hypothetical protein